MGDKFAQMPKFAMVEQEKRHELTKKHQTCMRLSELKTGDRGVIVKVLGHGGFRKRIVEMGFIGGKVVDVLLNAPLQDPVKYKVMGYEVSLRHSEAELIEVMSLEDALTGREGGVSAPASTGIPVKEGLSDEILRKAAIERGRTINVALVGNPNSGKTSLFNFASGAHERVGNYSGVTVDAKVGRVDFKGYRLNLIDLPGTYSLSAYSPEELYVRMHIIENTPDVIINVIDASNLERNLYLTTQIIDMNIKAVGALNMFDEVEARGDRLDHEKLGVLLGMPMVPTSFKTGRGLEDLLSAVVSVYEGSERKGEPTFRHIHLNHGRFVEHAIGMVQGELQKDEEIRHKYSTRFLAIKLLERDRDVEEIVGALPNGDAIIALRARAAQYIQSETKEDCETAIMNAKYGIINGALQEAGCEEGKSTDTYHVTHVLDAVVTNRWAGFPVFVLLLFIVFKVTFSLGEYPMDWIDAGVDWLSGTLEDVMPDGILKDLVIDGAIAGVGAVIGFLPQILILYFFISFMEDSGYMARAAFIMDKLMHKLGLHGKSFIPLVMGFGCNVPAVMATRTIESRQSRLVTILILPMMSCLARWPVYIMIIGTFFVAAAQPYVMLGLYLLGFVVAVVMCLVFSKWLIRGEDTPFVMELPPYRFPTGKAILRHTWEKGKQYLKKMGGIILVASVIVWALGYFPHNDDLDDQAQQEQSYIGRMGHAIEPVFSPQGFDWKLDISLIAGVGAKEIVASTIGVLYSGDESVADEDEDEEVLEGKYQVLRQKMEANGITPLIAFAYLIFTLIYFPCIATIAAIKGETGSWKWTIFTALYTTVLAWLVSAAVYQVGSLFA